MGEFDYAKNHLLHTAQGMLCRGHYSVSDGKNQNDDFRHLIFPLSVRCIMVVSAQLESINCALLFRMQLSGI